MPEAESQRNVSPDRLQQTRRLYLYYLGLNASLGHRRNSMRAKSSAAGLGWA